MIRVDSPARRAFTLHSLAFVLLFLPFWREGLTAGGLDAVRRTGTGFWYKGMSVLVAEVVPSTPVLPRSGTWGCTKLYPVCPARTPGP